MTSAWDEDIRGYFTEVVPYTLSLKECRGYRLMGKGQKEPSRQRKGMYTEHHRELKGQQSVLG